MRVTSLMVLPFSFILRRFIGRLRLPRRRWRSLRKLATYLLPSVRPSSRARASSAGGVVRPWLLYFLSPPPPPLFPLLHACEHSSRCLRLFAFSSRFMFPSRTLSYLPLFPPTLLVPLPPPPLPASIHPRCLPSIDRGNAVRVAVPERSRARSPCCVACRRAPPMGERVCRSRSS